MVRLDPSPRLLPSRVDRANTYRSQVSPVFVQFGVVLLLTTAFGATLALCTLPAVLAVAYARCRLRTRLNTIE